MLEQGQQIDKRAVLRHLVTHDARHEYLVMSPEGEKKLVHFRDSAAWGRLQRQTFHDQLRNLSSLNIPSACLPVQALEKDGELYCLYPLAPGLPLRESPTDILSARAAVELIQEIALLLEPVHRQQLFHGGLSFQTIHLEQKRPWLADFSLVSLVPFDYRTGAEVECASPEQIRGEPPGAAADVYSLGCLLYGLLTGRPPFVGADAFTVGMQHLNDPLPQLPEALAFCAELLAGMTVKSAGDRLTLQQVLAQIDALLQQSELDQVPPRAQLETPPATGEADAAGEAMIKIAGIEDQLRKLESGSATVESGSERRQLEEELPAVPAVAGKERGRTAGRAFFLVVGIIGGFCLGGLAFDFFLNRTDPLVAPQVYPLVTVPPDFDGVARFWLEGDLPATEEELNRLLIRFPDHPQVYNNLAAVAAARGDIDEARSWLEQAMVLNAEAAAIYRNLGEVYAEMARDSYGRALQLDRPQATLQLDLFLNQGVVSWPAGAQALTARVIDENQTSDRPLPDAMGSDDTQRYTLETETQKTLADQEQVAADSLSVAETQQLNAVDGAMIDTETLAPVTTTTEILAPVTTTAEPVTEPLPVEVHEDPILFLERWARAWTAQDVELYLSFYSREFTPAGGLDYDTWKAQRRDRLQRPDEIRVTLADFNVRTERNGTLQVELVQDYDSARYSDRTRKLFDLRRSGNSWSIERERSLELIYR